MTVPLLTKTWKSKWFTFGCYLLILGMAFLYIYLRYFKPESSYFTLVSFVYRDVNRNGIYDLEDRPFQSLSVRLTRPDGSEVTRETNRVGFANFAMKLDARDVDIREAGEYRLSLEGGNDWIVTSNNASQTIQLKPLVGSPSGLVLDRPIAYVGVAPALTIRGRLIDSNASSKQADRSLLLESPSGENRDIQILDTGYFLVSAETGDWKCKVVADGKIVLSKVLTVGTVPVIVSDSFFTKDSVDQVSAESVTVGFDHIIEAVAGISVVPTNYEGLEWNNWSLVHQDFHSDLTNVNLAVSSGFIAATILGTEASVEADEPFDFVGGNFGVLWPEGTEDEIIIQGWRGSELVYEDRFYGSTLGTVYFLADYRSITRLEVGHESNWHVACDDLEFRLAMPLRVPE